MRYGQILLTALCAGLMLNAAVAATTPAEHPEQRLIAALDAMQAGRLSEALSSLERLVRDEPRFRLAHLFHSQLLATRGGIAGSSTFAAGDERLDDLVDEARLRLRNHFAPPPDHVPDAILQLSGRHPHAIVVDLNRARLYLLDNNGTGVAVRRHYYASIGRNGTRKEEEGDNRTPIGVYRVTTWLDGAGLPDLYGVGAFPVNYPNHWDRLMRRTGHGIWLHGVPQDTYSRAPRSSEGCVTVANADLLALRPYIQPGRTPVVLSDTLSWRPRAEAEFERDEVLAQIETWRQRWSANDTDSYLDFYADDFRAGNMSLVRFAAHKRRVNAGKRFIDVRLSNLDLYRYPGEEDLILAEFTQDYRSDNFNAVSRKQQFWRRDGAGRWRIVKEEND